MNSNFRLSLARVGRNTIELQQFEGVLGMWFVASTRLMEPTAEEEVDHAMATAQSGVTRYEDVLAIRNRILAQGR